MRNKIISVLPLLLIVILAFFLRVYHLDRNPPSLNWDEVSHGYNAYCILKTGRDEWGAKLPLIFRAYGDYKLPLYIYITVPFVAALGLNELSVRLVSVLSGTGLVLVAYLLTKKIAKNEKISLFSAFLTAVSPWSLFLSRAAVEANLGAFLFALGIYFFVCWREKEEFSNLFFSSLFWGLSLHAYNSARILVPFCLLGVVYLVFKKKQVKQGLLFGLVLLVFSLPVVWQLFNQSGKARYEWVSLIDQGIINQIIERRNVSKLPMVLTNLIYNRPVFFATLFVRNYLANLSPKYLFFYGGSHYQFSLPSHELLYLVTAPFLLLGLVKCLKTKNYKILVYWFFLSLVPSAVTKDAPHVLRTILILPSPMMISAVGLRQINSWLKEKSKFKGNLVYWALISAVFFSFGRWWRDYQQIYPESYSWAWQYGYGQISSFVKENYGKYDVIFITKRYGEPHEFLLFYLKFDPRKYQDGENKKWDYHDKWYWINSFDKFEFVNDWEIISRSKIKNQRLKTDRKNNFLLITSPGNYPEAMPAGRQGWNKIKTINFLDEKPAFEILESN